MPVCVVVVWYSHSLCICLNILRKLFCLNLSCCYLPVLALTRIVLHPPETLRVDKDASGTAICLTSSGAPPPSPVEWRVNNEVVSSTGSITVQDNVLTVTYSEELNEAIIVCKVNEITSNKVTVGMNIFVFICCLYV